MVHMLRQEEIVYPESDGKPMAENTKQFQWIVTIEGGLEELFEQNPDVFIAGDLLWYPVEGDPRICAAPDAMVIFGRPKGHRRSYRQWVEGGIAPQVVFEVLSPGNKADEMALKLGFYEDHGVEEYYLYDPDSYLLEGWRRNGAELVSLPEMRGWVSPRLGIRFELDGPEGELRIYRPDGRPFATYLEVAAQRRHQQQRAELAEQQVQQERQRVQQERQRVQQERQQVQQERQRAELAEQQIEQERQQVQQERQRAELAEQQVHQERIRAEQERQSMESLLARLRAKGIELDSM
ncbi:MAG: Uma2 family endonuclease [Chloroflexi bacterium]|nr:Uma2 family endonuclease [Chloroflexota bacterium]